MVSQSPSAYRVKPILLRVTYLVLELKLSLIWLALLAMTVDVIILIGD